MKVTVSGLDELNKKFDSLKERAKELEGPTSVAIEDLLTPEFLSARTKFASVEDLKKVSGFKMDTADEFKAVSQEELDAFIARETPFSDWMDMVKAAGEEWVRKQMGI